jgi:cold shock CspA family protein
MRSIDSARSNLSDASTQSRLSARSTASRSPGEDLPLLEGNVTAIKSDKGYGFIDYLNDADVKSSVYFRLDSVSGGISVQRGDRVEFSLKQDRNGQTVAIRVRLVGSEALMDESVDDFGLGKALAAARSASVASTSSNASDVSSKGELSAATTESTRFNTVGAMRRWLDGFERDPSAILMQREALEDFLERPEIPFAVTEQFLSVLTHGELRTNGGSDRVYKCVLDSSFIKNPRNLRSFMTKLWTVGSAATQKESHALSLAVALVDELMERFPEAIPTLPLDVLESSMDRIRGLFPEVWAEINDVLAQRKATLDRISRKQKERSADLRDEDDFRQMPLFPTAAEIQRNTNDLQRRLNKNVISGKYDSVMHYLDTHFRLLREDAINSIREGIRWVRAQADRKNNEPSDLNRDIQVYTNVQMRGITTTPAVGVTYRVSFDIDVNVNWERSKRLLFGSLICVSQDNFENILWATVASRDPALLASKQQVDIRFAEGYEPNFDPNGSYTMVESVSTYYEAYSHVLQALQNTPMDKFPFQSHLIECAAEVAPPSYLAGGADLYNMYNVFDAGSTSFHLLDEKWPSDLITSMDESQLQALKQALTKEFAVIQGPPGTGKTFVGLKVMRALLENRNMRPRAPILVVCYTNHALDQFLEGVLQFEDNIVRIGSRSKSEGLKERNIRVLTQQRGLTGKEQNRARKQINQNLKEVQEQLDMVVEDLHKTTMARADIETVADDVQADSLFARSAVDTSMDIVLESWMGMSTKDVVAGYLKQRLPSTTHLQRKTGAVDPIDDDLEDDEALQEIVQDRMVGDDDEHSNLPAYEIEVSLEVGTLPDSISRCKNVWDLSRPERWRLYLHWLSVYRKEHAQHQLAELCEQFERLVKEKRTMESELQLQVLSDANVIGMTTTGVAKFQRLIQQVQPAIIIVEEAAEVLEAHIVAALSPATKHLILIGDHEQLRPSTAVYRLATKYNLDVSLFERMVNNNLEVKTLLRQRRMREDISALVRPIYPELYNHPDVLKYPNVKGVASNLFFINHAQLESADGESGMSKSNRHEATFLARLCNHLILQGYTSKQITVLTAYSGQVKLIRQEIRSLIGVNASIYVTSVDNYQGEENDIILLSLVRSNTKGIIGFLSTSNRICVALSRAKIGMYIIGNGGLLDSRNSTWAEVIRILQAAGQFGSELVLQCQNHPDKKTCVCKDSDFKKAEDGGCDQPCGQNLDCGHKCPRLCHPYPHSDVVCREPCRKTHSICGHPCMRRCSEDCGECEVPVLRKLKCGHDPYIPCYINDLEYKCDSPCQRQLSCGHKCSQPCGFECSSSKCREVVHKVLSCGHSVRSECYVDIALLKCEHSSCKSKMTTL